MKKYLIFGIIAITAISILIFPINRLQNEKGIIIFNTDKSLIFFVPMDDLKKDLCNGELGMIKGLEGFQFKRTLQNYNQFFKPDCNVLTSKPGADYGLDIRTWDIGKCIGSFSYKESIISNIISKFHYQNFSLSVNNKIFIKFRYIVRNDLDDVQLQELK